MFEEEDVEFWFWKYDWLRFDDAVETFEEEYGIGDCAVEMLEGEEDINNILFEERKDPDSWSCKDDRLDLEAIEMS